MLEAGEHLYQDDKRDEFIARVHALADRAIDLKQALYKDTEAWCAAQGVDLEQVNALAAKQFRDLRGA